MEDLINKEGEGRVQKYMKCIQNTAALCVKSMLRRISHERGLGPVGSLLAEDQMDNGLTVKLRLEIDRGKGTAEFDFTGTDPEVRKSILPELLVPLSLPLLLSSLSCAIQGSVVTIVAELFGPCLHRFPIVFGPYLAYNAGLRKLKCTAVGSDFCGHLFPSMLGGRGHSTQPGLLGSCEHCA